MHSPGIGAPVDPARSATAEHRDPPGDSPRRTAILLAALCLTAAAVRGLLFASRGDYLDWDEALYLLLSRNLIDGEGLVLNGYPHVALGPLVPLLTAGLSAVAGLDVVAAQRVLAVAAGALTIVPVWYLLRLPAGRRVAWIGASLLVGWTALIDVAPKLGPMWRHFYAGSEPFFLAFLFAALALGEMALSRAGRGRHALAALAGAGLGLAYLARPEAIVFGGLYVLLRFLPAYRRETLGRVGVTVAVAGLGFALIAGPYLAHVRQTTGSWSPSGKLEPTRIAGDLYRALARDDRQMGAYMRAWWALDESHTRTVNPYWGHDESVPVERQLAELWQVVRREWTPRDGGVVAALGRAGGLLAALWDLGLPLFWLLAIAGLVSCRRDPTACLPPFAAAGLLAALFTSLAVFALPRFFLYLVPAMALWAARGTVALARLVPRLRPSVAERALAAVAIAAGLALAGARTLSDEADQRREVGREDRLASERLAGALPHNAPVMTWHPRLAVWGGWSWRTLPVASLDATVHYAAARGVERLFLARGGYSPLQIEAPFVLVVLDPAVMEAYAAVRGRRDGHAHPAARLEPAPPVAGFATGRVVPGGSEGDDSP